MKRTRILVALLLVVLLTVGMPLSALAAVHDVTSAEEIMDVVATDTDAEVTMNMKNDIDMEYYGISGNEGQSYTINGNGNTIANVVVDAGDVTINADVEGDANVFNEADVAVNGDVESLYASDKAQVEITGDVGNVQAYSDSVVDITGDVVGSEYYWTSITAGENAQVSVDGNVSGYNGEIAPEDMDDPEATDNGGVGVEAYDQAVVSVTGNVTGGNGVLSDAAMQDPQAYGDGGKAINAFGDVTVTVGGDVTGGNGMGTYSYGGNGIEAENGATITVDGNVTGGSVVADPEVEAYTEEFTSEEGDTWENVWNSRGGTGIDADSTVTITVGGNVTGGSTNADNGIGGDALELDSYYEDPENPLELGSVHIGGAVSGGTGDADSEYGADGYDVYLEGRVGISENIEDVLDKLEADDLINEGGGYTQEFEILMNVLYSSADPDKLMEAEIQWLEDYGYFDEDVSEWTEEEMQAFMKDYAAFMLDIYQAEVGEVNMEELKEMYGYDQFAKLTIGEYDEDPSFCSYDSEVLTNAYMDGNVKALPEAATPETGDSFRPTLVGSIAILALLAMTGLVVIRRKRV